MSRFQRKSDTLPPLRGFSSFHNLFQGPVWPEQFFVAKKGLPIFKIRRLGFRRSRTGFPPLDRRSQCFVIRDKIPPGSLVDSLTSLYEDLEETSLRSPPSPRGRCQPSYAPRLQRSPRSHANCQCHHPRNFSSWTVWLLGSPKRTVRLPTSGCLFCLLCSTCTPIRGWFSST